jgi:hypothetical protein
MDSDEDQLFRDIGLESADEDEAQSPQKHKKSQESTSHHGHHPGTDG